MRLTEHLVKSLHDSAIFNSEVQVAPACILWPDKDRQWEAVIPRLQNELSELMVLGDYAPENRTGPAVWLRCVIAGKAPDVSLPNDRTPIFYLPGVSRQDLRAIEACPDMLKPLAELQYRGVIWSQSNAKDWTIMAYLKSDQGGAGLDVAQDNDAKGSMQLALYRLLDEEIDLLKGKRLDKDYFNTLLTGGDPVRDLLQWLDLGDAFQTSRGANEWKAFVEVCKSQMAFNPQNEGVLAGASKLASREGPWHAAWERYSEAPKRYPNIPGKIRQCKPPDLGIFDTAVDKLGGWPQWNDEQEKLLHGQLMALTNLPAHEARKKVVELEKQHGIRRNLVWSELGHSPLARAIKHLSLVCEITKTGLAAGSVQDLQTGYANQGWRADNAVLEALVCIEKTADLDAVTTATRGIYLPWLEDSARYLQKLLDGATYPGGTISTAKPYNARKGECVLFVDGLRFDTARRLQEALEARGFKLSEALNWTALPSVTATGKAAVAPVRTKISGADDCDDFEPCVAATGQSLKGGYHLDKLLKDGGWKVLERNDNGDGQGNAWCEFGDIDSEGHARGWKLAKHIDPLLAEIAERVAALLNVGWTSVRIVTDHGWLLMPGKLPKVEMAGDLTDNKWGRCASIKPGASTSERLYPWYWNPNQQFALADGVSCYRRSEEYTHGGLSLQECLTLELVVTKGSAEPSKPVTDITDISWKGLRCTAAVDGQFAGLSMDIREHAGDPTSSIVVSVKPLKENGTASVVIENEELQGNPAHIVLLNAAGELVAEANTVIGGG